MHCACIERCEVGNVAHCCCYSYSTSPGSAYPQCRSTGPHDNHHRTSSIHAPVYAFRFILPLLILEPKRLLPTSPLSSSLLSLQPQRSFPTISPPPELSLPSLLPPFLLPASHTSCDPDTRCTSPPSLNTTNTTLTPSPALSDYGPATLPDPSTLAKRRSTGASEALQYYWSSQAGGRSESIASSLGTLASPLETSNSHTVLSSPYSLSSPNPILHDGKSHSQMSFQEVMAGNSGVESPKGTRGLQLVAEPDPADHDHHHHSNDETIILSQPQPPSSSGMNASTTPATSAAAAAPPPGSSVHAPPPPSAYTAPSTLSSTTSRRSLPMIPDAGITPHGAQNTSHPAHSSHSMQHYPQRLPHLPPPPSPTPSPQPLSQPTSSSGHSHTSNSMTVDSSSDTVRSSSTRRKRPPLPPIPTSTPTPQTSSPASSYSSHASHSHRRLPHRPPSRPSSESGESEYSVDDSPAPVPPSLIRRDTAIRDELARFNSHRKGMVDMDGDIDVLHDPSLDEWSHQGGGNWNRTQPDSAASTIAEKLVTPTQELAIGDRPEKPRVAVKTDLAEWGKTASPPSAGSGERTPQGQAGLLTKPSPVSSINSAKGRLSIRRGSAPGSGSEGGANVESRRSTPSRSSSSGRHVSGGNPEQQPGQPRRLSVTVQQEEPETPHSAPAHKTTFGDVSLPGRPASLLPAAKVDPPRRSQSLDKPEQLLSARQQQLLQQQQQQSQSPQPQPQQQSPQLQQQQPQQQQAQPSPPLPPRRSPDPPPRSELRQPCVH